MPNAVFQLSMLALALAIAPRLCGQDPAGELQPVDQGVADVNYLSTSLRVIQDGLALPQGFQQVYALPGADGQLMRVSGAMYATFPYSSYVNTRFGQVATIPAGTVFHLGPPPELAGSFEAEPTARAPSPLQVNLRAAAHQRIRAIPFHTDERADTRIRAIPVEADERSPSEPPRLSSNTAPPTDSVPIARDGGPAIVTDEQYRAARLTELMQRAAASQRDS